MEGLESNGPMANVGSDPLLSASLNARSPITSHHSADDYRSQLGAEALFHLSSGNGSRMSPNTGCAMSSVSNSFNHYATLTPLQPLPPISTVTSSTDKYSRAADSSNVTVNGPTNTFFFTSSNPINFNAYNVNIKYEYDLKEDPPVEEVPEVPVNSVPMGGQTTEFVPVTHHQNLAETVFNNNTYVTYTTNIIDQKSPKSENIQYYTTSTGYEPFNGQDILDSPSLENSESPFRTPSPHKCSSITRLNDSPDSSDLEELNTKDLAQKISAELKRYSIPQAIFAQRVLCRSQGTLSDLLRNPKPWSKLKSGRETFRRMAKWLQEPEFQRMSALRLAACKRKEEQQATGVQPQTPKKPRLVFTDIQRRTLQAIFKETKRPSREMQLTISQQLQLDPTTVANFFMNARRRGHDRRSGDASPGSPGSVENGNCMSGSTVVTPTPHSNPPIFEQL
ncbi:hypothetical protein L596_005095 [Steinernema carpocapsae]|uniref:One cut domain family member n=2 Tax=Steinernema carpocapsae TaxID=34508 RepID=A0A4U8UXV1_STECR|nr:hypothetical protein L596_005095 [Steinernema carpocapsae]